MLAAIEEIVIRRGVECAKEQKEPLDTFVRFYLDAKSRKHNELAAEILNDIDNLDASYTEWSEALEWIVECYDPLENICHRHMEKTGKTFDELKVIPWKTKSLVIRLYELSMTIDDLFETCDHYDEDDFYNDGLLCEMITKMKSVAITCEHWVNIKKYSSISRSPKINSREKQKNYTKKAYTLSTSFEDLQMIMATCAKFNDPIWYMCFDGMIAKANCIPHLEHLEFVCRGDKKMRETVMQATRNYVSSTEVAFVALSQPN